MTSVSQDSPPNTSCAPRDRPPSDNSSFKRGCECIPFLQPLQVCFYNERIPWDLFVMGFVRFPSGWNFGREKLISENREMTCSWRGARGFTCTKFEVTRTNIHGVTLPVSPSVSSGDLVPDVRLTSTDVRSDVTTKGLRVGGGCGHGRHDGGDGGGGDGGRRGE